MTLRLATEDDIPKIVFFAKTFHGASQYSAEEFDEEKVAQLAQHILSDKHKGVVIFYVENGIEVGCLAGTLVEVLFSKELVAAELMWWVDPQYRSRKSLALKEAFEFWGKRVGAKYIQMSNPAANPKVARYYERTGYAPFESSFLKRVS